MKLSKALYSLFCIFIISPVFATSFQPDASYQVCFTPETSYFIASCTNQIVQSIDNAKSEILVQAYSFTSMPIARALVQAKERGVDVKIILDKSQQSNNQHFSIVRFFQDYNIPVWIDDTVAIAHNKVMVIDKKTVIEGSFNFTNAAEKYNAENVNIIIDSYFAKLYIDNWENRKKVSTFAGNGHRHFIHHSNSHINQQSVRQIQHIIKHFLH